MSRWFQVPEVTVAAVSFVLHLVWELAQVPLFPAMPMVPELRVGLSPVLQWMVTPPVVIWFTRRLIAGIGVLRQES